MKRAVPEWGSPSSVGFPLLAGSADGARWSAGALEGELGCSRRWCPVAPFNQTSCIKPLRNFFYNNRLSLYQGLHWIPSLYNHFGETCAIPCPCANVMRFFDASLRRPAAQAFLQLMMQRYPLTLVTLAQICQRKGRNLLGHLLGDFCHHMIGEDVPAGWENKFTKYRTHIFSLHPPNSFIWVFFSFLLPFLRNVNAGS